MRKYLLLTALLSSAIAIQAQIKILFDATKAETAGSADWIIDADLHNLGYSTFSSTLGQPYIGGSQSNPGRYPTPAQSGISSSTPETYWNGAISAWGVALAKRGYIIETLPAITGSITYGNSSNAQDLSNYKMFVVDEPNILFSSAEKTAIVQFVQNGGRLCIIADHNISDRNNDGYDSPHIWNNLFSTNSVRSNPFGITFDTVDISGTYSSIASPTDDSLINGSYGAVTSVKWSGGTTMKISTAANASVRAIMYKSGTSSGSSNILVAKAFFGKGRVAAFGDSSPFDDGTGDSGDVLYNGWTGDVSGNHSRLIMNTSLWLLADTVGTVDTTHVGINAVAGGESSLQLYPNPASDVVYAKVNGIPAGEGIWTICDMQGRAIMQENYRVEFSDEVVNIMLNQLAAGYYTVQYQQGEYKLRQRLLVTQP